jgi:thiosulfate/3-mercaptopyruvate sulfurtransferase
VDISHDELVARLGDPALTILDVRSSSEFSGETGYACDARQGHIPGARHLDVQDLASCSRADEVRTLVALPAGAEIVAYCHSGSRSAWAVEILLDAGYAARNYAGSWHMWSHAVAQPAEPPDR